MAGSISLAGAQQFDVLGNLLGGAKIYWIQAGTTSTPQNAYYDTGLVSPLPNPYTLDADARIPFHYLADGQIKVRIVDSNGVTRFEQDNILVIGPSSGGGGGGGVDPTTVFATGDVLWLPIQGTRSGWVRANGRTMGSASFMPGLAGCWYHRVRSPAWAPAASRERISSGFFMAWLLCNGRMRNVRIVSTCKARRRQSRPVANRRGDIPVAPGFRLSAAAARR